MGWLVENPSQLVNRNNLDGNIVETETENNSSTAFIYNRFGMRDSITMTDGDNPEANILPDKGETDNIVKAVQEIDVEESNNTLNLAPKCDSSTESSKSSNKVVNEDIALERSYKNITEDKSINEEEKTINNGSNNAIDITIKDVTKTLLEDSKDDSVSERNGDKLEESGTDILDKEKDNLVEEVSNDKREAGSDNGAVDSDCERYTYVSVNVEEEVMKEIENKLEQLEEIPEIFYDIPIECFSDDTQHRLCYHLDPESQVIAHNGFSKDYLGLGEWIDLEPLFMKYLHRTMMKLKTIEVLGKWITIDKHPHPTIRNFVDCMCGENGIDRPDVVMDLTKHITKDAIGWVRTGSEACTAPQTKADKSWQLTRHDVVTGKKTYYTSCLVYADEDEGMAQIITKLYKSVFKQALFFLPQFDLKIGKYEFDTTAKVIQERCDGRVVFILSEYFFASEVCRFAVQFSRAMDAAADAGNLIPFHLTNQYDHVPRVLKGISGIRWFRKAARKMSWSTMTDTILGGRMEVEQLECLKYRLLEIVENDPSLYLGDPPYDEDTPCPGPPIEVNDPPLTGQLCSYDPSTYFEKLEKEVLASARSEENTPKVSRLLNRVKTRAVNAIHKLLKKKSKSGCDKCSADGKLEENPADKSRCLSEDDSRYLSASVSGTEANLDKNIKSEKMVFRKAELKATSAEKVDNFEDRKQFTNKNESKA